MKNNTKVRLHLSKQLFESLAKQVLTEAKGKKNFGAGMEEVKATKGKKEEGSKGMKSEAPASGFSSRDFAEKGSPRAKPNSFTGDSPKKPGAAKGASKQGVATALKQKGVDLQKDPKANVQSAEGGLVVDLVRQIVDLADNPDNAAPILTKIKRVLDQNQPKAAGLEEMETMTAESDVNPAHYVNDPTLQLITQMLTSGLVGTIATTVIKGIIDDVKKGKKTPKQAAKEVGEVIEKGK